MTDSEAREMARGLVRGSIIEDAASQFIAQVLKEAHDSRIKPLRDRIEELEAALAQQDSLWEAFKDRWTGERKYALRIIVKYLKGEQDAVDTLTDPDERAGS